MRSRPLLRGLFLDRDGVVNINRHYVGRIEDFEFNPGIFELCSWARSQGFVIVIVTNQSGVGRGLFTIDQYHHLTNWMLEQFSFNDCEIDLVVASPIDPNGENNSEALIFRRKPNPGMIFDACEVLNIDPHVSVLIGDSDSDVEAAQAAGIPTIIRLNRQMATSEGIYCFGDLNSLLENKELVIK